MYVCGCILSRSVVSSSLHPRRTAAHQAPLPMEFSRRGCWSRLTIPTPGDLPDPGIETTSPASPVLAVGFFTTTPPEKPKYIHDRRNTHILMCRWMCDELGKKMGGRVDR